MVRIKGVLSPGKALVLVAAALLSGTGAGASAGSEAASRYDLEYVREDAETVALVNGKRLSDVELKAAKLFFAMGHGKAGEPRILDRVIEQELIIQDAVRRGAARDEDHLRDVDILFFTHLGMDYYDNELSRRITIDAEEVGGLLPAKWVKAAVEFVLFPSIEEARDAAAKVGGRADFDALRKRFPENAKNAGGLYPKSGYFQEFDDAAIFAMKKEGFYGALATGAGPAVLYVTRIETPGAAERDKMLERARETVRQRQLGIEIDRIGAAHSVALDGKGIREYIAAYRRGGEVRDLPLAKVDDKVLGVVIFRMLAKREPLQYLKSLSDEELVKEYEASIRNVCRTLVLGLEAQKIGYGEIRSAKYRTSFNNLKRRYYLYVGEKEGIGPIDIADELIRDYYGDNLEREFKLSDMVRAGHIFVEKDRKKLEKARKLLNEGRSFSHVAMELSEDKPTSTSGGDLGWLPRNASLDPAVRKAVFGAKTGSVTPIVKSKQGFHIFKVYEFRPARTVPFEEAKESIRTKLYRAKLGQKRSEFIKTLKGKAKIEKTKAGLSK